MFQTTFSPGPSQVSKAVKEDIKNAVDTGIIEISHRSKDFSELSQRTIENLRQFFHVPNDYYIFYTSSATEAWELTIRSLVETKATHFTNGSFSESFASVSQKLYKESFINSAIWGEQNDFQNTKIPQDSELITLAYNETSTGVKAQMKDIEYLHATYPNILLAVDIVSIAGVESFDISKADVWLFSVQKALGLPAGLGIMFVSPRAYARSIELGEKKIDSSCLFTFQRMQSKMEGKYQTVCTPNVLNIYLLGKQLERWNKNGGVQILHQQAMEKYVLIKKFVETSQHFSFFVKDESIRSFSAICLESNPEKIAMVMSECKKNGIIMGSGYGKIKETTIRIANFPAISVQEVKTMIGILQEVDAHL